MLFVQPYFFSLFSPANFSADLAIHVAVIPVILFGLIMAHLTLVRLQGIARPL
jgi:quinol-cytochrome oxidoreductase complex cytochrome b subunit